MAQQGYTQAVIPSNVEGSLHSGRDYTSPPPHHVQGTALFLAANASLTAFLYNISIFHGLLQRPANGNAPPSDYRKLNNGFTLVELAIALMVIGLLIGGVLKGQELIENARVTRTVKDLKDYDTAVMIFRNTYNALPGDMRNAATRLPNCGPPYCSLTSSVTGDGMIANGTEMRNVWIHLDRAGLISGINEQADSYRASPVNAFGGYSILVYLTAMGPDPATEEHPALHHYRVGDPNNHTVGDTIGSCTRIRMIDDKMDDGKPLSGSVKTFVDLHDSTTCHDTDSGGYTNARTRTHVLIESSTAN